jgi:O-antigen ligase
VSKAKTISKTVSNKATVAKASSGAARDSSTRAAALPLGFASAFGLLAFGSLCFLVFISPYLFSGFWPSSYEYWPQGIFLALTAATCVLLALEPVPKLPNSRTAKLLALFLIWCALSIFVTAYLHDSLLEFARVSGVLAWFFIARALLGSEEYFARRAGWLLVFVAAGAVLVCIPAILDFLKTHNPRQFGTFYNPNLFANYCALSLPLCASRVLALWRDDSSLNSNLKRGASVAAFLVIALGLFLTSSKGGFLAALCGLLVFAFAVFRAQGESAARVLRARRGAFLIGALLVLIISAVLFSKTIAPRLSSKISEDHSTMFRVYTWRGTLKMARARPFLGFGVGSFPSAYTQFAETGYTRTSHELWLQLAAECGFPAMLLLLCACGASTLSGVRALNTENWIFAAGSLGAVTAFFIHGLTDAGWSISSIGVLAMCVIALLEGARREARGTTSQAPSLKPQASNFNWFWLSAALPLALGSWLYQRAQSGEDLRSESRELMARGLSNTAIEKARAATQADSFSARLLYNEIQTCEASGQDVALQYELLLRLQRMRALNYLYYAEYLARKNRGENRVAQLYKQAIALDRNDTEIRLSCGKWKLKHQDQGGWFQIESIAELGGLPYGKYPATPEMVDLNYARAYAMLAERDAAKNKAAAKNWIERGLSEIAEARKYEPQRREMEQATQGAVDESRVQTMDELEAQFKSLQEKLK